LREKEGIVKPQGTKINEKAVPVRTNDPIDLVRLREYGLTIPFHQICTYLHALMMQE